MSSYIRLMVIIMTGTGIAACRNPPPDAALGAKQAPKPSPEIVSAQAAVESPDIPTIDPMTLDSAEVDKVLSKTPRCAFSYTAGSSPVLVVGANAGKVAGVIKVHGKLVKLTGMNKNSRALPEGGQFAAQPITVTIQPQEEVRKDRLQKQTHVSAIMHFELDQGLTVGYEGWWRCNMN
ncbi:hypothetical protein CA267_000395 [Alteromonas pelagimontana]|uniref:Uncharacterized protein n=1 Tax=Alteromonas pelagimontana TaxID=1858656 RepID=A0A6M4M850_9ALTE|nr:hypothetical protein [Alteromonas pelagimontana]QJR79362.1 hypothetical protein CA267_000395 [Alteromonas pelagimontana]